MGAQMDDVIVEQADKIASAIGGPAQYRRSLTDLSVAQAQWEALRQDGWHQILTLGESDAAENRTLTLCKVAERFGSFLIAAPIANLAIAHHFVAPHIGLESIPLMAIGRHGGIVTDFAGATHIAVVSRQQGDAVSVQRFDAANFALKNYPHGLALHRVGAFQTDLTIDTSDVWRLLLLSAAAELVGIASAAHNLAVDYLKIRSQFGRPLGSFQALQHRAANDTIALAEARALIHQSAAFFGSGVRGERLACAAFSKALENAIQVTSSCIQMFGAIGFTAEHDAGLFLKRVMHIERVVGAASLYRSYFADSCTDAGLASEHRRCRA